jgi:hypothetical protein
MKKNVIFWCAVNNSAHADKYDSFKWFEYSRESWQYWCKKHDIIFYEYTTPTEKDLIAHRVTWQRWFDVFDMLDQADINYDKIFMVDATSIIRWDAPNIFNLCTDDRFVAWRDCDNLSWVYHSVREWKSYFKQFNFDLTRYINCGSAIINETHRPFLQLVKKFYYDNYDEVMYLQNTIKKGTDQTPFNYLLQLNNIETNLELPIAFNVRHIARKDMFHFNWQLNEDTTPFCIKYGYICRYTGFPKDQRTVIMKRIWDLMKHNYSYDILDTVNHKDTFKNATSRKFKQDLLNFFDTTKLNTVIEFGCCHGDTTKVLSIIARNVYASDLHVDNIIKARQKCSECTNIIFEEMDVSVEWNYTDADLIYLDALHDIKSISRDLDRIKQQYPDAMVVMDDYGHEMNTVKIVIDSLLLKNEIDVLTWLGEDAGYISANGKPFVAKEGLIFKFKL